MSPNLPPTPPTPPPPTAPVPVGPLPVLPVVPVYEPGTAQMPPLPGNYRHPEASPRNVLLQPTDDVERAVGGEMFCPTYLDRDLIPAIYRREGTTTAYVQQGIPHDPRYPGDSFWYLRGGIDNTCWVPEASAGQPSLSTLPDLIRGGDASEEHFAPGARFVLY